MYLLKSVYNEEVIKDCFSITKLADIPTTKLFSDLLTFS